MAGRDNPYLRDDPYQDEPDGDTRPPRRHTTRPARPAWDAMTYGRPDDARRPPRLPEPEPSYGSSPWPEAPGSGAGPEPSYGSSPWPEAPGSGAGPEPSYGFPSAAEAPSTSGATDWRRPYEASPSYESRSAGPEPDWASRYGPAPTPPAPPPPVPAPPAPTLPASAYPAAAAPYPASVYPAATDAYTPPSPPESFAPESYTSYRAAPVPAGPSLADEAEPVYVASGLYLDEPSPDAPDRTEGSAGSPPSADGASAYPGGLDEQATPPPKKGGRNLPAAIGVGVGLGALVLGSLFFWRPAFVGVVAVFVGVGVWELVRALRRTGANAPLVPLLAGGMLMTALAWWGGPEALTFGLVVTVVAVMAWRFAYGTEGYGADVTMAALVAVYVPFLGGFAAMLARPDDGHLRVLAMLIAVVLSDTGGYVVGAKFGRHAMAPSISPKKSWEGLAGSLGAAAVGSSIVLWLMFDVALGWGLLFGLAVALASVVGDLGESMVKRAIGVKDMSDLLPGHGGAMDRLDSILFAAPVGYVLLSVIAPVA